MYTDPMQEVKILSEKKAKYALLSDLIFESLKINNVQISDFVLKFNEKKTKEMEE